MSEIEGRLHVVNDSGEPFEFDGVYEVTIEESGYLLCSYGENQSTLYVDLRDTRYFTWTPYEDDTPNPEDVNQ